LRAAAGPIATWSSRPAPVGTEMRVLATPASVHSVPTGAGREDHVAMGPAAARKARRAAWCLSYAVAAELLCGAEAVEHHRPLTTSPALEAALAMVRGAVPRLSGDRPLRADLEALAGLVRGRAFLTTSGSDALGS